jgi:hypothetical protein
LLQVRQGILHIKYGFTLIGLFGDTSAGLATDGNAATVSYRRHKS